LNEGGFRKGTFGPSSSGSVRAFPSKRTLTCGGPSLALGGVWTEVLDDAAIVPLPATPERVEAAIRGLRGASLLTGGRGGAPFDVEAAARLAAAAGEALVANRLELLELNPVIVHERGVMAVDAVAAA
jgi:acetate---CoA ligase (ADP-forming)